jgi:hypothetical protein
MKINKAILAAVLGLGVVSAAQAADVFLTGSTAMRSTVFNAMTTPGVIFNSAGSTFTGYGGNGASDTFMGFTGVLKGGSGTVNVLCDWSGSEAGIKDVVNTLTTTETFIADGALNGLDNTGSPTGTAAQAAAVNVCMADNDQPFSRTTSPHLTQGAKVGVVTFKWLRNQGVWTGNNVTDSQIQQALSGGAPVEVFNDADTNSADSSFVYVAGRDTASGTRVNALGDSGYGILTSVGQVELTSGALSSVGNTGQGSGGTLAKSITYNTATTADPINGTTGFTVIAYLGASDAATALAGTGGGVAATELTYDGVPFSASNIQNGTYTFWGYEFCFAANNVSASSNPSAQLVFNNISSVSSGVDTIFDYLTAIPLDTMQCSRSGPLGQPAHN